MTNNKTKELKAIWEGHMPAEDETKMIIFSNIEKLGRCQVPIDRALLKKYEREIKENGFIVTGTVGYVKFIRPIEDNEAGEKTNEY